jgi:hypothetical protein
MFRIQKKYAFPNSGTFVNLEALNVPNLGTFLNLGMTRTDICCVACEKVRKKEWGFLKVSARLAY